MFVRCRTDTATEDQNTVFTEVLKKEPVVDTEAFEDVKKEPASRSDLESEEFHNSRSSRR